MLRRFVFAVCVLALASSSLLAEELRGTIKKVDPSRNCFLLTVGDQDHRIEVTAKMPVYTFVTVGRPRRASTQLQQTGTGMESLQPGMFVTVQTRMRDGVEMATEVRQDNVTTGSSGRRRLRR